MPLQLLSYEKQSAPMPTPSNDGPSLTPSERQTQELAKSILSADQIN
jgi:hypothetical protein